LITAIIDADTLVYEASLSSERTIEWDNDLWTLHSYLPEAIAKFDGLVEEIKEATDATRIIMVLSAEGPRWRNTVMETYKKTRKKTRRPVVFTPLRKYCQAEFETFMWPTLEGDDLLGILMTHPTLIDGDKVCVSIDKDLKTIPGKHYNYGRLEHFEVTEREAESYHMLQALMGDSTDGYGGCPKYGKVTATKLLDGLLYEEMWPAIVKAYTKAGLSEEVALENARVARICRHTDFNFDTKEVVLWNP
jgi:DNA polymerase I